MLHPLPRAYAIGRQRDPSTLEILINYPVGASAAHRRRSPRSPGWYVPNGQLQGLASRAVTVFERVETIPIGSLFDGAARHESRQAPAGGRDIIYYVCETSRRGSVCAVRERQRLPRTWPSQSHAVGSGERKTSATVAQESFRPTAATCNADRCARGVWMMIIIIST